MNSEDYRIFYPEDHEIHQKKTYQHEGEVIAYKNYVFFFPLSGFFFPIGFFSDKVFNEAYSLYGGHPKGECCKSIGCHPLAFYNPYIIDNYHINNDQHNCILMFSITSTLKIIITQIMIIIIVP